METGGRSGGFSLVATDWFRSETNKGLGHQPGGGQKQRGPGSHRNQLGLGPHWNRGRYRGSTFEPMSPGTSLIWARSCAFPA